MVATTRLLEGFAHDARGKDRRAVIDLAHRLIQALETPADILRRIGFSPLELVTARLAVDLKIFEQLANAAGPLTDSQMAAATEADPILIARINRYLASYAMIDATETGSYMPNEATRTFAREEFGGALLHMDKGLMPAWAQLPQFLHDNGYRNPSDPAHSPFNDAFQTNLLLYQYYREHPKMMQAAGQFMRALRDDEDSDTSWLKVYSFGEEVRLASELSAETENGPEKILFVDVGGGLGHQCQALRRKFPDLDGRVINQDLAEMLHKAAGPPEGVEFMPQDFFQPQQLNGSPLFFYLRNVLHDYPDSLCVQVLSHLRDVLAKAPTTTRILIDEVAVPEVAANRYITNLDMTMMSAFSSQERTLEQWRTLVGSVEGLKLTRHFTYETQLSMVVMEVEMAVTEKR